MNDMRRETMQDRDSDGKGVELDGRRSEVEVTVWGSLKE